MKNMVVVDANLAIKWVVNEADSGIALLKEEVPSVRLLADYHPTEV